MKRKDLALRLAITAIMLIAMAIIAFAELGIATAFDMKFDGLSYMEYIHEFYRIPWHFALALVIYAVVQIVCAEGIYRSIRNKV